MLCTCSACASLLCYACFAFACMFCLCLHVAYCVAMVLLALLCLHALCASHLSRLSHWALHTQGEWAWECMLIGLSLLAPPPPFAPGGLSLLVGATGVSVRPGVPSGPGGLCGLARVISARVLLHVCLHVRPAPHWSILAPVFAGPSRGCVFPGDTRVYYGRSV